MLLNKGSMDISIGITLETHQFLYKESICMPYPNLEIQLSSKIHLSLVPTASIVINTAINKL